MTNEILLEELISEFKKNISMTLNDTQYQNYINEIVIHYISFLKISIKTGLIQNDKDLEMYRVKDIKFFEGNAYASWLWHTLTLQPRFFNEINENHRKNVIFHELIHSLMEKLFSFDNEKFSNFSRFCRKVDEFLSRDNILAIRDNFSDIFTGKYYEKNSNVVSEVYQSFNEVTTQYLSEMLCARLNNTLIRESTTFDSKILSNLNYFKSSFLTYPEYQQLFNNFLRTINGFGNIDDDTELFDKWFSKLSDGSIWNQIIGSYKNNYDLLYEFLITFAALRKAKESSMGSGVEYKGDKEKLTNSLIELDQKLISMRNYDEEQVYEYIKFDIDEEPIHITIK